MFLNINITAIYFTISIIMVAFIIWRGSLVWKKQKTKVISKTFFQTVIFFFLYTGIGATVGFYLLIL